MDVKLVDFTLPEAPRFFTESMLESGFAVITNHNIARDEISDFYRAWEHFFVHEKPEEFLAKGEDQAGYFSEEKAETAKGNNAAAFN